MRRLPRLFAASVMLLAAVTAQGAPVPARVVILEMCVAEREPERIEAELTSVLEKLLLKLPGVASFKTVTSHGSAQFEIHFKGDATEDDLASVVQEVERSDANRASRILSRSARLGSSRPDELLFVSSLGCLSKHR